MLMRIMSWTRLLCPGNRCKKRLKSGNSLFADIFFHSTVNDYYILRILYNFPIGLFIGWAMYSLAWNRLNFGDFDPVYTHIFQSTVILGSGLAFAFSPVFRCATICVCIGGLGKSGQGLLTLYVAEQISQGPVENILYNFELTTNIIVCHLELQGELALQKLNILTGPLESLFEKHFGSGVSVGKKALNMLKSLVQPFRDMVELNTEEDDALAKVIDSQKAFSQREHVDDNDNNSTETVRETSATSGWGKMKSALAKSQTRRVQDRCKATFAMASRKCEDRFADAQPSKMQKLAEKHCRFDQKNDSDLDTQIDNLDSIGKELERELKVNLHFKAIEQPRDERLRILSEITEELKNDMTYVKVFSKSFSEFLSAIMVLLVYNIFNSAVTMTRSYLNNIEFNNHFLTSYFWRIDRKRALQGKECLVKVRRNEMNTYKLLRPVSQPSWKEVRACWQPLLRFGLLLFLVLCIVTLDHLLYKVLSIQGQHRVQIEVRGNGTVADLIRNIVQFNYTNNQHRELSNRVCMVKPRQFNRDQLHETLLGPLAVMFLLQVLFNFVVKRVTLLFVVGFIFRSRAKARIVHLYNKLVAKRLNDRRLALASIRYHIEMGTFKPAAVRQRRGVKKLFAFFDKLSCTLCQSRSGPAKTVRCSVCKSPFCGQCWLWRKEKCPVCEVQKEFA